MTYLYNFVFHDFFEKMAAVLASFFSALQRVCQIVTAPNFAPGNAGIIFSMDIVVPLVGFLLLGPPPRLS